MRTHFCWPSVYGAHLNNIVCLHALRTPTTCILFLCPSQPAHPFAEKIITKRYAHTHHAHQMPTHSFIRSASPVDYFVFVRRARVPFRQRWCVNEMWFDSRGVGDVCVLARFNCSAIRGRARIVLCRANYFPCMAGGGRINGRGFFYLPSVILALTENCDDRVCFFGPADCCCCYCAEFIRANNKRTQW